MAVTELEARRAALLEPEVVVLALDGEPPEPLTERHAEPGAVTSWRSP